ncbi:HDOD domain-containing protein [Azoarcus sp. KH32C]|uniref:HDOD domain-containing protein n=1 Tax=Azoarcus sp. KH32C TaxID=748247 RepID=UPI0002385E5C|nr:HDOD domain-containing protein [Azoarcus sp. KH32C]BAL22361.1 hypothetical protein AZKH_0009 [Azoarcus sp. KH32C]
MLPINIDKIPPISPLVHDLLSMSLDDADAERRLLKISASEPQVSIRLVAIANSVAYRRSGPELTDTMQAIRRIGLARTRQLAIGLLFGHPLSRQLPPGLAEDVWLHSLAMAAAAQEIAHVKRHPDPATAYLAGLVHDLGYLVEEMAAPGSIARTVASALNDDLAPEQAEERLTGTTHARLAADLLTHWRAPAAIVEALADHHRDDIDPDSLAAVVFGAEKLARFVEVTDVLYAGREHPFAPLSLDRLGLEFLFEQQLDLSGDEVSGLAGRIVAQVGHFQSAARAMGGAH